MSRTNRLRLVLGFVCLGLLTFLCMTGCNTIRGAAAGLSEDLHALSIGMESMGNE